MKNKKFILNITFAIIFAISLIFNIPLTTHARSAKLSDGEKAALTKKYAPILHLHRQEKFFPTSIEHYLQNTSLYYADNKKHVQILENVNANTLITQNYKGVSSGTTNNENPTSYFLKIKNPIVKVGTRNLDDVPCYAYYREADDKSDYDEIQYWFFYAFNGNIGPDKLPDFSSHEGDWEHITIRLTKDTHTLLGAYLSAHDATEGQWYTSTSSELVWERGTHPHIYVANESHANYSLKVATKEKDNQYKINRSGKLNSHLPTGCPDDHITTNGPVWDTENKLELLDLNKQPWLKYSGIWGNKAIISGPTGPYFKDAWKNGDSKNCKNSLIFYKENNCVGNMRCSWIGISNSLSYNFKNSNPTSYPDIKNDEVRSMKIVGFKKNTIIKVFDNPDGKTNDDWTEIFIKQDMTENIYLDSFEKSFENAFIKVTYHKKNGLDGKISRLETTLEIN